MQTPDGNFTTMKDLEELKEAQVKREKATGKPHPIFTLGEELEIRGGKFRVHAIRRTRLILKPVKY